MAESANSWIGLESKNKTLKILRCTASWARKCMKILRRTDDLFWENECHAAWEACRKTQNERHAAWERLFCKHGPDGSPQKGRPKPPKPLVLNMFRRFLWPHWSTRRVRGQKRDHSNWTPKSSKAITQNIRFPDIFCYFASSGLIWRPPQGCRQFSKLVKKHCFYKRFWRSQWAYVGAPKGRSKIKNERHAA